MKGLTLTQPWGSLAVLGEKHFETRSWGTRYRGLIAVHAAKGFPGYARAATGKWPFFDVLREQGLDEENLPLGAILGLCMIADCRQIDPRDPQPALDWFNSHAAPHDQQFGDYTLGRYMWLLRTPVMLPEPIPCRGMLGLWDVPPEVASQIALLLAAGSR